MRPGQWPKNLIAVPLAAVGSASWSPGMLIDVGRAVVVFTLAAALVYLFNDVHDRHRDRLHPVKRLRPIAAGTVGMRGAATLAGVLTLLMALTMSTAPLPSWWPVLAYMGVNLAYSRGLKHISLLDAFLVASGFVLRLFQGYTAIGEHPSTWLSLCVLTACLLLLLGKRRHELAVSGADHRPCLSGYSMPLLDQLLVLAAALTAVSYLLYLEHDLRLASGATALATLSVPCVLFGLARYLQVLMVERGGGNPMSTLFRDRATLANLTVWTGLFGTALALTHTIA
ncbi:UbiA prenyltransferase family protein [Streptomyces monticola]|uniref:UbiA prenyltransferase family protein n=1 Tax=Streptomyces monticola TaxID=2666263 RepID=A0ABW2JQV4_9ACTN